MGMIRKIMICPMLVFMLFLSACGISLYGIELAEVVEAHGTTAYYLSEDGTLYCTGAVDDGGSYAVYQEPDKGIIARHVKSFNEMTLGGYYIDYNDDLYMWNKKAYQLFGYNIPKKHQKILEDVVSVIPCSDGYLYIDVASDLYLFGTFMDETHSIDKPKLIASNVVCAVFHNQTILWTERDGTIGAYGEMNSELLASLNAQFAGKNISGIYTTRDYIAVLSDHELWFYGDYKKLASGVASSTEEWVLLADNIVAGSFSWRTIAALDSDGKVLLWGRCISNDENNTEKPQFEYYESFLLTNEAKSVYVSDSCVCYIDKAGNSRIFHAYGLSGLYGNSTDDMNVGINREPITWVE